MLLLTLLACTPVPAVAASRAPTRDTPTLVVLVVLDQYALSLHEEMRGSYTAGLARFEGEGAWAGQGRYPYGCTWTAPGHATLATGRLPSEHGIAANRWYEPGSPLVQDAHGPEQLFPGPDGRPTLTVADAVQAAGGRTVALSIKERGARFLGGSSPTLTVSLAKDGKVDVRGAKADELRPQLTPPDKDYTWTLFPGASTPRGVDGSGWEPAGSGERVFPHVVPGALDVLFTPAAGTWLAHTAGQVAEALKLGGGTRPDLLTVSFSEVDYVGHRYTPESWEAQDNLRWLDRDLGALFQQLDDTKGADGAPLRWAAVLTADHGVLPTPAAMLSGWDIADDIEAAWASAGVPGRITWLDPGMYFEGVPAEKRADALRIATEVARRVDGVGMVVPGDGPLEPTTPYRRELEACRATGRVGDLLIWPRWGVGWMDEDHVDRGGHAQKPPTPQATGHGTPYAYDREVPILAFGAGVRSAPRASPLGDRGEASDDSETLYDTRRIAPTLACLADVAPVGDLAGSPLPLVAGSCRSPR